jgi:hypothetical protein
MSTNSHVPLKTITSPSEKNCRYSRVTTKQTEKKKLKIVGVDSKFTHSFLYIISNTLQSPSPSLRSLLRQQCHVSVALSSESSRNTTSAAPSPHNIDAVCLLMLDRLWGHRPQQWTTATAWWWWGGERGVCNRESEFLRFAVINCRLLGLACRNIFIH